jgi:hypothetical protein
MSNKTFEWAGLSALFVVKKPLTWGYGFAFAPGWYKTRLRRSGEHSLHFNLVKETMPQARVSQIDALIRQKKRQGRALYQPRAQP